VFALADGQHHHVGGAGGGHRRLDPAGQGGFDIRALDEGQQRRIDRLAQTGLQRRGAVLVAPDGPGTEHVAVLAERPDHGDPLALFGQGQQVALVLQ
jgi:hypothetical protein